MLIMSNMGDHVWLITSRHTDPDLSQPLLVIRSSLWLFSVTPPASHDIRLGQPLPVYISGR